MSTPSRGRGRPPAGRSGDRRAAILAAARAQFAAKGFTGASLRSIARDAGVDASLISHYFGGKAQLLVATMELPVDPVEKLESVVTGELDGMAERLLRTFCGAWDPHHEVFSALVRTTVAGDDPYAPMLQLARNVLVSRVTLVLDGEDIELRAGLVAAQLIGMATMRYVARLEPVAQASVDDLVRWYAPAIQHLLSPRFGG